MNRSLAWNPYLGGEHNRMSKKRVSVVICVYQTERYNDLAEAIDNVKRQSHKHLEVVVVVDGNRELYDKILKSGIGESDKVEVKTILNEKNLGLSESRNRGIKEAKGDVIAFLDDDAVADEDWVKELVRMYEEHNAIAAGGKLLPKWISKKPKYLPEEFYWLIGATHKGFPEEMTEVRNTFGSNISFKAEVLKALGGFKSEFGFRSDLGEKGKGLLQGEETELCERMREKFGRGVAYNPNAVVYHKIFPERLRIIYLLRRAFWQGYSKRIMKEEGGALDEESVFLKNVFSGISERILQLLCLFCFTFMVILGYGVRALKFLGRRAK